ncbi:sulfate adenylyltransferase subunit 1 [Streptomyces ficellus]|uniref:sulfate adenylyltransferase n=1 Tax=Streptomyces ficellus TaxID=1977088 RepID=A0A1W5T2G2_9ACTN|nr:GTP-binding protein [Streptomyces ficellus]ARF06208.1 sulfate adenylyltransferase subunit 1 [Streptomyces ficellus]QGV77862.1 sulfate adenylyltransferase [Streptomyces ficellus]
MSTDLAEAETRPGPSGRLSGGLLRLATCGSVDDGKSTLVGRLLYDTKSVLGDQLAAIEEVSRRRGQDAPDLALLTDGLRAEREQGITIDVAYRYFATHRRRFILADTPGHVQYTRNMVTGASTADLAVILVDARNGVVAQTMRHCAITALLRVPHVVLAVNKMDAVGYRESTFTAIADEFTARARELGAADAVAIPMSALAGDNVVEPSTRMDWYDGDTLLSHLEGVPLGADPTGKPLRLPVQYVIRQPSGDRGAVERWLAGQLASGVLRVGDPVTVQPAGATSTVVGLTVLGRETDTAWAPQSVAVRLADDIDIARGDVLAAGEAPVPLRRLTATVCHLDERPLRARQRVLLKHTTRTVPAVVEDITYRTDVAVARRLPCHDGLSANDIGGVRILTAEPLAVDDYAENKRTGSFLLIDPQDGSTLSAGMVDTGADDQQRP